MFDSLKKIWGKPATMEDVVVEAKKEKRMATIVEMEETSPLDQFEDSTTQEHEDPFKS